DSRRDSVKDGTDRYRLSCSANGRMWKAHPQPGATSPPGPATAVNPGGNTWYVSRWLCRARPICLRLFVQLMRLAASRTFCTAGSNRLMRMAMMAMTTSSSMSVKALRRSRKRRADSTQTRNDMTDLLRPGWDVERMGGPGKATAVPDSSGVGKRKMPGEARMGLGRAGKSCPAVGIRCPQPASASRHLVAEGRRSVDVWRRLGRRRLEVRRPRAELHFQDQRFLPPPDFDGDHRPRPHPGHHLHQVTGVGVGHVGAVELDDQIVHLEPALLSRPAGLDVGDHQPAVLLGERDPEVARALAERLLLLEGRGPDRQGGHEGEGGEHGRSSESGEGRVAQ